MKYLYVALLSVLLVSCGAAVENESQESSSTNNNVSAETNDVIEVVEAGAESSTEPVSVSQETQEATMDTQTKAS